MIIVRLRRLNHKERDGGTEAFLFSGFNIMRRANGKWVFVPIILQ